VSQPAEESRVGYTLVVGAEQGDRAWVEATLEAAGLEVAVATDEEVRLATDWVPPHLVILDDNSARQDRRARQAFLLGHPNLQGVPLLVLAYDTDIDSYSSAITKGAAAYLVKPVKPEELVLAAQRLCGWVGASDRTEKRRRLRRPLLMKVDVDIRSRKVRVPGQMLDASGTGCRLEVGQEIEPGEMLRVILHTHEDSTHVALGAEVRWHRVAEGGAHLVGLKFTGTTALLAGKILGFASTGST
jgi:response regulator RpfG family c-di-GMP phosphodiesterase